MLTRWIKCLILGLITLSNFSAGQALAAEKKNVCAMTINSNDEIELFKKHLSPEQFNFIELTETVDEKADANGNENNAWLKASCKKGIICDVLVISGHFGGNFFGESGINLPLETLETASCDSACSGILHKPKEVFLFGCNTLAGKEQDSRTPEQYAAVLQQDGFTIEQAQQIAAFRYSPIGSSFNDRMSRIFSKVPRIYGFSSIAPSGKNIAPHLRGYLKDTAPTYFEQLTAMTSESNAALKGRLKGQPFVQTKGANEPQSPVCFIRDDKTSTISKLKYTLQVLEKGGALELAPYLSQYFEKLDQKKLNPAERRLLEDIYQHESGREKLAAFVAQPIKGLLKAQVDTLNLMLTINWISEKNYDKNMTSLILQPLYDGIALTRQVVDQFCSLNVSVKNINPQRIKPEYWKNKDFYQLLTCLKPHNSDLMDTVYTLLGSLARELTNKYTDDTVMAGKMIQILSRAKSIKPEYTELVISLLPFLHLTGSIVTYSEALPTLDKKFRNAMEDAATKLPKKSSNGDVLFSTVLSMSHDDPDFLDAALNGFLDGTGTLYVHTGHFAVALKKSTYLKEKLQSELDRNDNEQRLFKTLQLTPKLPFTNLLRQRLLSIATGKHQTNTQLLALSQLSNNLETFELYVTTMNEVINGNVHFATRRAAISALTGMSNYINLKENILKILETEKNPQAIKSLRMAVFEIENPYSSEKAPFHTQIAHPIFKLDTQSQLLRDLNSGKMPYFIDSRVNKKDGLAYRTIYIGLTEQDYLYASRAVSTGVLYDNKTKTILGLLSDNDLAVSDELVTIENMHFAVSYNRGAQLITGAIQRNPETGKVEQDFTDSMMQAQLKLLSDLKSQNKDYAKIIESNSVLLLTITATANGGFQLNIKSSEVRELLAHATVTFTPGVNGIGTVQINDVALTQAR